MAVEGSPQRGTIFKWHIVSKLATKRHDEINPKRRNDRKMTTKIITETLLRRVDTTIAIQFMTQ
eukprot:6474996-Amphidinium_carterae.1